ncbi:fibropellin-1-like isoform X1 [Camellia sinensis]|uniref:fibropellin-1-like isoform X1 n=1 Tax=Camellia sinensis TaxID=4442 RepID=UPI0010369755|nr:fibropellin-1-like isoform X1 [Camellia sinensis]
MAASHSFMAFVAIILAAVVLPLSAKAYDGIAPILVPYADNICKEVECGKGNCSVALDSPFGFKCECENGWKRTRLDSEQDFLFLPCVIPNCSLDYSCMPAAPPAPSVIPLNSSLFDPCYWVYCGGGTCTKNKTMTHTCQCNPGYSNLLNITAFPCYSDCALGSDCAKLGIKVSNSTSSSNSNQDNICKEVECGKGNCSVALDRPFGFKCECENGWKHTRLDSEQDLLFLPCVIPNCSLDYSCMPAAPPAPSVPLNSSVFDPCYWVHCGEGTCTKNKTMTQTCQCNPGYSNLLNITAFPCYSDCALGSDCAKLGIKVSNSTSSSNSNQGSSFLPGTFHWIAVSLMSIVMVMWK